MKRMKSIHTYITRLIDVCTKLYFIYVYGNHFKTSKYVVRGMHLDTQIGEYQSAFEAWINKLNLFICLYLKYINGCVNVT